MLDLVEHTVGCGRVPGLDGHVAAMHRPQLGLVRTTALAGLVHRVEATVRSCADPGSWAVGRLVGLGRVVLLPVLSVLTVAACGDDGTPSDAGASSTLSPLTPLPRHRAVGAVVSPVAVVVAVDNGHGRWSDRVRHGARADHRR